MHGYHLWCRNGQPRATIVPPEDTRMAKRFGDDGYYGSTSVRSYADRWVEMFPTSYSPLVVV